jgi:LuxR family maltose regulon positive regulatory protein
VPRLEAAPHDELVAMAHGAAALTMLMRGDARRAQAVGMPAARRSRFMAGVR